MVSRQPLSWKSVVRIHSTQQTIFQNNFKIISNICIINLIIYIMKEEILINFNLYLLRTNLYNEEISLLDCKIG